MSPKDLLLCAAFSLAVPTGQMLFKWAALQDARFQGGSLALRLVQNYPLLLAFVWYGAASILWVYILTRVPLTLAYPMAILGSGLVPLFAWALFREPVSWSLAIGYVLMLAGVVLTQRGAA
jgi:multidrug transporter EmrE-like cation transporter